MNDIHIHIMPMAGPIDPPDVFMQKTALANVRSGNIFSLPPASFRPDPERSQEWKFRLEHILEYTSKTPNFIPFFWIDPTEKDASLQIETATQLGIKGFKCICNHFYPSECLKQFEQIGEANLPILFHTGILFDHYHSSPYTHPTNFEALINIKNLRFALAHISWPWTDECYAVFGKMNAAKNNVLHDSKLSMYIDLTPGTPLAVRKGILRNLYLSCFQHFKERVLWGSDNRANDYNYKKVLFNTKMDKMFMEEIADEWKNSPVFDEYKENYPLKEKQFDDIFTLATEKNHLSFYND